METTLATTTAISCNRMFKSNLAVISNYMLLTKILSIYLERYLSRTKYDDDDDDDESCKFAHSSSF
jgi:hypothetical protein